MFLNKTNYTKLIYNKNIEKKQFIQFEIRKKALNYYKLLKLS